MSRCLSHDLIKFQNEEEAKFLDEASKNKNGCDKEFLRQLYSATKVTVEDLNREYSPEEIRQLCLRTKLRVNMTYFNIAWDIKTHLEKEGRLKDRSEPFINAMIAKGVTRNFQLLSSPKEISKARHIRECLLKKQNNMRLDRWRLESQRTAEEQTLVEPSPMGQHPIEEFSMEHKITVEDLNRVYSPEEITQLCLRTKVRVNMTYNNCAWDIKTHLEKMGRLKDRSERFINAMIVKCVTRKSRLPSSPKEISKARHIRECLLKKQNNMRLDRWRLESQRTAKEVSLVEPSPMEQYPIEEFPIEHLQVEQAPLEQSSSLQLAQTPNEEQSKEYSVANIIYSTSVDPGQSQEVPLIQQHADEADIDNVTIDWLQAGEDINTDSLSYVSYDISSQSSQSENQTLAQVSEYDDKEELNVPEDYDCRSDISGTNSELFRTDIEPLSAQKGILQPTFSHISEGYNEFNTQVPRTSTPISELNP